MIKYSFIIVSLALCSFVGIEYKIKHTTNSASVRVERKELASINIAAVEYTFKGLKAIQDSLHETFKYVAIIDYSKPSTEKRFYLIDLTDCSILSSDYVCHGKHSGENFATQFSNEMKSNKTSLGFYKLSEMYYGEHGLAIRMDGLDQGFNDNARERSIVMHSATYADPAVITELGRLGRSLGCPTLPMHTFQAIASKIANNTVVFHYYPDVNYLHNSVWLH